MRLCPSVGPAWQDQAATIRVIQVARQQRNNEMLASRELLEADKKSFKGLHYFPIDLRHHLNVRIEAGEKKWKY